MANVKQADVFRYTRTAYYNAGKQLTNNSELLAWSYLADGNPYDKVKLMEVTGKSDKTIKRVMQKFEKLGYYVDGVFYAVPRLDLVPKEPSVKVSTQTSDDILKANVKIENNPEEKASTYEFTNPAVKAF